MKRKNLIRLALSVLIVTLAACAPATPEIPVTGDRSETPIVENTLADTSWELISLGPRNEQNQVIQGTEVTLQFNDDGSAVGSGGCNSFGAKYSLISDHRLTLTDIFSTEIACTAPGVMEQEQQYFEALQSAGRFERSGDSLKIWYAEEQGALNFVRAGTSTPVPPTPTPTSLLPTIANPTATAVRGNTAQRITFAPGSTTATLIGSLATSGSHQYVLRALAGQTLSIDLTFTAGQAILVVWGADGNVLLTDHAEASTFERVLPATQDYYILVKGRPDGPTSYTMTVAIPQP